MALLLRARAAESGLFRHTTAENAGWRGHVGCFADQVYPIQALAEYARCTGDADALQASAQCAQEICDLAGAAGQWWWHYDVRTGAVLERYPVYSVHQDGMAPLALWALAEAGGPLHRAALQRGLDWLNASPELDGASLIDEPGAFIWRKVARREPRKWGARRADRDVAHAALVARAGGGHAVSAGRDRLRVPPVSLRLAAVRVERAAGARVGSRSED